jgi:hypothetical protein
MSVKVLYTTHAVATGGRSGHTRSADGLVDVGLEVSVVWAATAGCDRFVGCQIDKSARKSLQGYRTNARPPALRRTPQVMGDLHV